MAAVSLFASRKIPNALTAGLSILVFMALFAGCGAANRIQGEHYLRQERYREGVSAFREKLRRDPFDISANSYMGRYLLALDRPKEALAYLKEAAELDYYSPAYYYWLGNCYHALGNIKAERLSYRRALELDARHLHARLDLGHSYLEQIGFYSSTTNLSDTARRSLDEIGSVLSINRKIHLRITAHEKGSLKLARQRAGRVRDYLINHHPVIDPRRISVTSTTRAEKVQTPTKTIALESSVGITTTQI
jgi:tetratricopeptide (TPR) repeat protein